MNKRILTIISFIFLLMAFTGIILSSRKNDRELIIIKVSASLEYKTIDDLIKEAEIIMVGNVKTILLSQWKSPNGIVPSNLTAKKIFESNLSIFTDTLISVNQVIKGKTGEKVVRVRSFIGKIDQYQFVNSIEPIYEKGQDYLLFLHKDEGPTQIVDPGNYIAVNAIYGVFEIVGEKAISADDEWLLEDLLAYIQQVLSEPAETPTESVIIEDPSSTPAAEVTLTRTASPLVEDITPTP